MRFHGNSFEILHDLDQTRDADTVAPASDSRIAVGVRARKVDSIDQIVPGTRIHAGRAPLIATILTRASPKPDIIRKRQH